MINWNFLCNINPCGSPTPDFKCLFLEKTKKIEIQKPNLLKMYLYSENNIRSTPKDLFIKNLLSLHLHAQNPAQNSSQ